MYHSRAERLTTKADRYDRYDAWVTLDAATGKELAVADLGTDGHAGVQLRHPDGSILLDVGMGQDGSSAFRGRFLNGAAAAERVLNRTVCATSLDESVFLSLSDEEEDIRVHRWPDGHLLQAIAYSDVVPAGRQDQDWWVEPEGITFAADGGITVMVAGYDEEADDDWIQDVTIDAGYRR